MDVTYIFHSCFLVETSRFYYLFDYEQGDLPRMDGEKPIFVLSSHGHDDHYTPEIFPLLTAAGMKQIRAVLSDDIDFDLPENTEILFVAPESEYDLGPRQHLTTFRSTDLGVAFLIEDDGELFYHAGDLNDWVWDGESEEYNAQMTARYRHQMELLSRAVDQRTIDVAFVVLDPRQEKDYDRGLCCFLEKIPVRQVYPMHYWEDPSVMDRFLADHPEHQTKIHETE